MAKPLLRFNDLKQRKIAKSRAQLKRMIDRYGFPPGRMLTPNCRTWTDEEVDSYIATCPVEGPAPRGAAKAKQARRIIAIEK